MRVSSSQPESQELACAGVRPWSWRQYISARLGLQGKLLLCFMVLLSAALGASCWLFVSMSTERLTDVMGEQARQMSHVLSLAAKPALAGGQVQELNAIGQDLLKSRNVLFVAFMDEDAQVLSLASRDPNFVYRGLADDLSMQWLMQVRRETDGVFGDHLEILAPVLSSPRHTTPGGTTTGVRLLGYVALGMSQSREQEQIRQVAYYVLAIGCLMTIGALPLAYTLVHRIFQPIRELVTATREIAAGDMDTQVAIHRPDVIGVLARSFNEMVDKVRRQQQALADANARLEQANRDLEEKVRQRTGQLEAANRRLSSEIAEKEEFLRTVSHDLNAPLRNISGMATMLLLKYRDRLEEDAVHRLERIQKNVEMETGLITELLELSRIKTRRQKMEPVDVGAMVRELGEMFENDLKTRRISLLVDTPLPVIHCERLRLRQVFQNLIDNAIKYMGDGPVRRIHVGCAVRPSEAEFYVHDTGIGIDKEDLDKVFGVFRRGKNGASKHLAGKGVGLASVKSIVETYNGTIWIESRVGEGSTFRFTINGMYVMGGGQATQAAGSAGAMPASGTTQPVAAAGQTSGA